MVNIAEISNATLMYQIFEKRSWGVRRVTTRIFHMGPFKKGVTGGGLGLNVWAGG